MKAKRILLVEDDIAVATLLADVLAGMGHGVCSIEDSQADAVAAAGRLRPDLMIVDARLRDGCGVAAVQKILEIGFVPHLFVSGNTFAVLSQMPDAVVIQKPFFAPELALAIQAVLKAPAPA
jgi:two-component system, response regulator PdtaR